MVCNTWYGMYIVHQPHNTQTLLTRDHSPVFTLFLLTENKTNPFSLDVKLLLGSERRFHLKPVMMFTVSYDPLCGSFKRYPWKKYK